MLSWLTNENFNTTASIPGSTIDTEDERNKFHQNLENGVRVDGWYNSFYVKVSDKETIDKPLNSTQMEWDLKNVAFNIVVSVVILFLVGSVSEFFIRRNV